KQIFNKKSKGFTFVELLVAISVITVLSAITIVAINPVKRAAQARNAERWSEIDSILKAVLKYGVDNNISDFSSIGIDENLKMIGTSSTGCSVACGTDTGTPASFTHNDNSSEEFGGGTYNNTQWDASNNWIELTDTNNPGDFTSKIVDAGSLASWNTISWIPQRPSYKELLNNKAAESGYPAGNINMTGNVLLMHMNESSGVIFDSSGEENNGTNHGATYGVTGKFNTALNFDGINDYVEVPHSSSLNISDKITLEAWAKDPPGGWLSGYTYRKKITLNGQSGAGTGYLVKLKVGESSGSSGADLHLENHSADFPNDIRFTDDDGITKLSHWLEGTTGTAPNRISTFWVKVNDNLNTNQDIYIYYGKAGASSASKMWDNVKHLNIASGVFDYNAALGINNYHSREMQHRLGVSGEGYHTCVLKFDGNVHCWGDNTFGQAVDYTGGDAIEVAAGGFHTCVLKSNGNVDCWGDNTYGQSADYSGGDAIAVSAGEYHTCVLKSNGNVDCYGSNTYNQAPDGDDYTAGDAIAVSAGGYHSCVLKSNGNVNCWGDNNDGQSADYTGGDAIFISAGGFHTCVLKSNGNVDCWGDTTYGQSADYLDGDAIGVSAGVFHTCVLKSNGNVDCYGSNTYGQSTDYTGEDAKNPFRKYVSPEPSFNSAGNEETLETQNKIIISKGKDAYSLEMSSDGATLYGYISNHEISTSVSNPTNWHHFVMTFDGADQKLYIDGAEKATQNIGGTIGTNTNKVFIGEFFSGVIDEVAIYNRALSAEEILDHYKRGALRLKFQTRSCNDAACSGEIFTGPDGTASSYYTEENNNTASTPSLSLNVPNNHYFQYKIYFETDDVNYSPELKSVTVDYTVGVQGYTASSCLDLSGYLVPSYLVQIPEDPKYGSSEKTYYAIKKTSTGRIKVQACKAELNKTISTMR
ncbi:DUF2341 domain-containing protein, partial [candidate division WOR-3 bacterium]|nr:DUF2341 domain-containing protein [candidate division WOR-3 bacterium]